MAMTNSILNPELPAVPSTANRWTNSIENLVTHHLKQLLRIDPIGGRWATSRCNLSQ